VKGQSGEWGPESVGKKEEKRKKVVNGFLTRGGPCEKKVKEKGGCQKKGGEIKKNRKKRGEE